MKINELASFDVVHEHISWPWIAFDASGSRFAFASSRTAIATRVIRDGDVVGGPTFAVPADLALHAFTLAASGTLLAAVGIEAAASDASVVVTTNDAGEEQKRSTLDSLVGPGFTAQAIAFDRSGARLWLSAESATETALLLLDARTQ